MSWESGGIVFPRPVNLIKVARKLEAKETERVSQNEVSLDRLLKKARRIQNGSHEEFSRKEAWSLPFLLNKKRDEQFISFLLPYIPTDKPRVFRRLLHVYMSLYIPESDLTEKTGRVLLGSLRKHPSLVQRVPLLCQVPDLILKGPVALCDFLKNSIQEGLRQIHLPDHLSESAFVCHAIFISFRNNQWAVWQILDRLKEIREKYSHGTLRTKKGSTPYKLIQVLADPAINQIEQNGNRIAKDELTRFLIDDKVLGYPRFYIRNGVLYCENTNWSAVSPEARKIFKNWWNQSNLDFFFEIIKGSVSTDSNADQMWTYRQKFWNAYIPDMINTSVILGKKAQQIIKSQHVINRKPDAEYARLEGGQGQSVLLFTIGRFTFIEISHNGKLRIFDNEKSPIPVMDVYSRKTPYPYIQLQDSQADEEFRHSWPQTYSWQKNVSSWIGEHCGIRRGSDQWTL